jgi:pimeloyl-ACP methyl ester carboxylesterase
MGPFALAWRLAAVLVGLAAIIPVGTGALAPRANPAANYEAALTRAHVFQQGDSGAAPGGKSVLQVQGHRTPRAVVFFHGLTNSPRQYRDLVDSVFAEGDNVFVPRLPWHALVSGNVDDLGRLTATELRDVADESIDIAAGLGDTVIVVGISLGGNMAAWVAQFRPVYRAVIVAPALGVSGVPRSLETPAMNLALRVPNYSSGDPPDTLRPDRTLGWTTRGVAEGMKLGAAASRNANRNPPHAHEIRFLVNANDGTVSRSLTDQLLGDWKANGANVSLFELPDSLRLPHDVIDPDQPRGRIGITEPVLLALLRGTRPGG